MCAHSEHKSEWGFMVSSINLSVIGNGDAPAVTIEHGRLCMWHRSIQRKFVSVSASCVPFASSAWGHYYGMYWLFGTAYSDNTMGNRIAGQAQRAKGAEQERTLGKVGESLTWASSARRKRNKSAERGIQVIAYNSHVRQLAQCVNEYNVFV